MQQWRGLEARSQTCSVPIVYKVIKIFIENLLKIFTDLEGTHSPLAKKQKSQIATPPPSLPKRLSFGNFFEGGGEGLA